MFRLISKHRWYQFISLFAITLSLIIILTACLSSDSITNTSSPDRTSERIAKEHQGDIPVATEAATQAPAQPVTSEMVNYATLNGKVVQGFFTQPTQAERPLPGIIAIHEWWGLNDNIKAVAERLAGEGYSVLAVDLYNGQVADQPPQAKQLSQSVRDNPQTAQDNLKQAYQFLVQDHNASQVGSIGWCFGGAWSLNTGLLLPNELDALVIYYGRLKTDPKVLASLKMPIAGFFGGQDQGIPLSDVKAFESALNQLDKTAEIHIYEQAGHAFANPSGQRYNPEAAADAWQRTIAFFSKTLKS